MAHSPGAMRRPTPHIRQESEPLIQLERLDFAQSSNYDEVDIQEKKAPSPRTRGASYSSGPGKECPQNSSSSSSGPGKVDSHNASSSSGPGKIYPYSPSSPNSVPATPGTSNPLLSPTLIGTPASYGGWGYDRSRESHQRKMKLDLKSSPLEDVSHFESQDLTGGSESLDGNNVITTLSDRNVDFYPPRDCPAEENYSVDRSSFIPVAIILLSVYSTVFSIIFSVIAVMQPEWGQKIGPEGVLSPTGANILTSGIAKTIELSFITACIVFIGQVLSRRAFGQGSRGASLADMNMRQWIMQPGLLITCSKAVKYAGFSFLGLFCLTATVIATFYTSAATAIVQPALRFTGWKSYMMSADVWTAFAYSEAMLDTCPTRFPYPVTEEMDHEHYQRSCLSAELTAQSQHHFQGFTKSWANVAEQAHGSTDQRDRPQGFALYGNTTITPAWVDIHDVAETSAKYGRIINNVSLAVPHIGISKAAKDPRNRIAQPSNMNGLGFYSLHASVASPTVHVLCANMNRDEAATLVIEGWRPHAYKNETEKAEKKWRDGIERRNGTVVDDVFNWDVSSLEPKRQPPSFLRLPSPYNTVANSSWTLEGIPNMYVLGLGGAPDSDLYFLCSLTASLKGDCSTRYNVTATSSFMEALCEDPEYSRFSYTGANNLDPSIDVVSSNWTQVAEVWSTTLGLGAGIYDNNGTNSRVLTQLALTSPSLHPTRPSPAEALAVLASSTLLTGAEDASFAPEWNYTSLRFTTPVTETFAARLYTNTYASGKPAMNGQLYAPFLTVILLLAILNLSVLVYFLGHSTFVTDVLEPPNLFALAVNSPPAKAMKGACGAGPKGDKWAVKWNIRMVGAHLFFTTEANEGKETKRKSMRERFDEEAGKWNGQDTRERFLKSPLSGIWWRRREMRERKGV